MDKFKLESSIQFPFFKLNEIVSYSEVKKPSGIAFMILVLINESTDKDYLLANLLENFGVPKGLHYIYADTIKDLIKQEILKLTSGDVFHSKEFNTYRIRDFAFTQKGKKIFAEESIPTGKTKEAKIPVYFDIAKNELSLLMDKDLEGKPLMDSYINEPFMAKFECKKDLEAFINLNKGVRIPIYENGKVVKYELIKKEEIITDVQNLSNENWTGKYDCTMSVDGESIKFSFDDPAVQKFFDFNYTAEIVNKAIEYKTKFMFKSAYSSNLSLEKYKEFEIVEFLIPKELDDVLKQRVQLFVSKGNYSSNNGMNVPISDSMTDYLFGCEFITVDQADNRYAYVPGVFTFKNNILGDIRIPLVLKIRTTSEELKKVLVPYINSLSNYSEENFKNLVKVSSISKDYDRAYGVLSGYLNKDNESNIVLLNEMKQTALLNANILSKYKELLKENFDSYIAEASEENLDTVLKIVSSVPKFLNLSSKEVIDSIFKSLGTIKNKLNVFETMTEHGFDKNVVVMYANPLPDCLRLNVSTNDDLSSLLLFNNSITELKKISNINDVLNYGYDEENINKASFKKAYGSAVSSFKTIQFLKPANHDYFIENESFMKVFGNINDELNMVEAALSNPKNIKAELIDKKITSGDYQFVFVNLSAKLEMILKNKFKLDGKLSDMLSEVRRTGKVDRTIASDLHDFRENRNAFIHPEDRTPNFKSDDIRRWAKEIFELEEDEK